MEGRRGKGKREGEEEETIEERKERELEQGCKQIAVTFISIVAIDF